MNRSTDADTGTTHDLPTVDDDAEAWAAFGPQAPPPPGRVRRLASGVRRVATHEWTLACLGALVLAVVMTWPTLRDPLHTIPQDIYDPTLQAWQMAWSGHILSTDPGQLWQSNAFYPEPYSFAFSDTLLGYAPAGLIGTGPVAAVLRYNIMYVLAYALAFVGAYALVRQLGAGRAGAAVAGAGFAFAPWRLAQAGHLQVLSVGGIALALAMLARGHGWSLRHGFRPRRAHAGWAAAGWAVAAWQVSLGFAMGLPFAYVLAAITVAGGAGMLARRRGRPGADRLSRRLIITDLVGGALFAAVGTLLALPYLEVARQHPEARRSIAEVSFYSPPLRAFFTAPAESRLWGGLHAAARQTLAWPPEMTLLLGYALYGLAAAGLLFSIWTVRQRLLLLAGVLGSLALAMGTHFFGGDIGYLALYRILPGWDGIRTPGRLVVWTVLLLGVLAAGAVSAFGVRIAAYARHHGPARLRLPLRIAQVLPVVLVLVEGLNLTPHPRVPDQPAAMRRVAGPVLVLPSDPLIDENVMLWSTSRFQPIVNGGSSFTPDSQRAVREISANFPDASSVNYLRTLGVRTVVVLRDRVPGTPWQAAATARPVGLGVTREEIGDAVVFHLDR